MKQTIELTTDLLRKLALMQYHCEDFFILNGTAYEGTLTETKEQYNTDKQFHSEPITFNEWVADNCTEVEELEADDCDNYMVLTNEEADEKATEYIKDSLWAFTPSFLAEQTDLDPEIFEAIQSNGKCEDNNDVIYNTIQKLVDIETFVEAAISTDGRGHFMSSYDGCENEETVEGETFYIYRIN